MSKRGIGFLIGLIVVLSIGTLIQDFSFDGLLANERAYALAIDRDISTINRLITDVRSAQGGYVAPGQTPATWMSRATESLDQLRQALNARRTAAPNSDTRGTYETTLQAVETMASVDKRVRAALTQDDRLHAADLVYIDSQQAADLAGNELAAARVLEDQAAGQRMTRLNMLRLGMNAVAVVMISIIAVYFGRALSVLRSTAPASTAQMIRDLPPPVKATGSLGISGPAQPVAGATSSPVAPAAPPMVAASAAASAAAPMARPISLATAAELCVDLARVLDGRDVPGLLERTAGLLDAKGIMIWSVDTGGAILRPAMFYGYSEKVMSRIRPIQVDADNVTSLAFRSMQPQSIPGTNVTDPGALAVPLISSTGCVGVLAAEVKQGRPHPDLLPIARIIAAQFSTLVSPLEAQPAAAQGSVL